jgi:hypothetical protein
MEASVAREGIDVASAAREGEATRHRREERRRDIGVRREEKTSQCLWAAVHVSEWAEQVSGVGLLGRIEWAGRKKTPEILPLYY